MFLGKKVALSNNCTEKQKTAIKVKIRDSGESFCVTVEFTLYLYYITVKFFCQYFFIFGVAPLCSSQARRSAPRRALRGSPHPAGARTHRDLREIRTRAAEQGRSASATDICLSQPPLKRDYYRVGASRAPQFRVPLREWRTRNYFLSNISEIRCILPRDRSSDVCL